MVGKKRNHPRPRKGRGTPFPKKRESRSSSVLSAGPVSKILKINRRKKREDIEYRWAPVQEGLKLASEGFIRCPWRKRATRGFVLYQRERMEPGKEYRWVRLKHRRELRQSGWVRTKWCQPKAGMVLMERAAQKAYDPKHELEEYPAERAAQPEEATTPQWRSSPQEVGYYLPVSNALANIEREIGVCLATGNITRGDMAGVLALALIRYSWHMSGEMGLVMPTYLNLLRDAKP